MTRRDLIYLAAGLAIGVAINASLADGRLEGALGRCYHQPAPDTSWHYDFGGYRNDMEWRPTCGSLGIRWKPDEDSRLGVKLAYVDLGIIRADNTFPTDEQAYKVAKATKTAVQSATARYEGSGGSRGLALGPVYEIPVHALTFTAEAGLAELYSTWHAMATTTATWAYADGWVTSPYVGAGVRWRCFTFDVLYYTQARASQAKENPQFVGPTSGKVVQTLIGLSFKL